MGQLSFLDVFTDVIDLHRPPSHRLRLDLAKQDIVEFCILIPLAVSHRALTTGAHQGIKV